MRPAASTLLLGHFCSIITSLALTPDQRGLVSTDRDHKIRVSHLSAHPLAVSVSGFFFFPLFPSAQTVTLGLLQTWLLLLLTRCCSLNGWLGDPAAGDTG